MSEFKSECGGNPEPFHYLRDDESREDARSPEANPTNFPEESRAQEDEEWKEADFQINEENDGGPQVTEESDDENRRKLWKNRLRSDGEQGRSDLERKLRRIMRKERKNFRLKLNSNPECPENPAGGEPNLWNLDYRPARIERDIIEVIVNSRTQNIMTELLNKADKKTKKSKKNLNNTEISNAETSDAVTSDAETSDAVTSDAETSDAQTSDTETSDAQTSDMETSDAETSDAETSNAAKDKNGCNFLTQAWEFEEKEDNINDTCIQENKNDPDLDAKFYEELMLKKNNTEYKNMCAFREKLPAHKMKDKIVHLISENKICFISGGTGCGKTTQIVQFVLDDWIMNMNGSICNIVCTQPRRISALSIAQRIADERLEPLSLSVGYQIRFENKLSQRNAGCINFVTTGVLLQWLVTDPFLPHVSHIFLDEVHEKTIEFDAIMALLKNVIQKRSNIKLILMSATVDSASFCNYFGGTPDLEIPGYTFPVEEFYLDDIINMTDYKPPEKKPVTDYKAPEKELETYYDPDFGDFEDDFPCLQNLVRPSPLITEDLQMPLIIHLIRYICLNEEDGSMLVFLPGLSNIIKLKKKIEGSPWYSSEKHFLVLAHSMLPTEAQSEVFTIPPEGTRKIILATSVMETSVTLDDVSYVVDSGKIKCCTFDIIHKVSALNTTWISTANAMQRKGRVGRTKPGKCYKLYTKDQENSFNSYPPSDIQMTSLEHIILRVKLMKIKRVSSFLEKMMDPPHPVMIESALKVLRDMNALDSEERLTALGYHLSNLPMDVRTGKIIIMGALFSCIDPIFSVAACLSYKDPFNIALDEDKILEVKESYSCSEISDHIIFSDILKDWENRSLSDRAQFCAQRFLSPNSLTQLSDVKEQFATVLYSMNFLYSKDVKDPINNVNSRDKELIKAVLYAGLYPNVAILSSKTKNSGVKTIDGQFAFFHGKSHLSVMPAFDFPFFIYFYKLRTSRKIFLHDATMIEVLPLLLFSRSFEIIEEGNHCFIHVDDKLKFKMRRRASYFMKEIKTRLDQLIGEALLKSEGFNWSQQEEKIKFLRGVVNFISNNSLVHEISNPI